MMHLYDLLLYVWSRLFVRARLLLNHVFLQISILNIYNPLYLTCRKIYINIFLVKAFQSLLVRELVNNREFTETIHTKQGTRFNR